MLLYRYVFLKKVCNATHLGVLSYTYTVGVYNRRMLKCVLQHINGWEKIISKSTYQYICTNTTTDCLHQTSIKEYTLDIILIYTCMILQSGHMQTIFVSSNSKLWILATEKSDFL